MVKNKEKDWRELLVKKSTNQIKLLSLIAVGYARELTGQIVQGKIVSSGSAISQALKILEDEDFVEKETDRSYRIIDPLLKAVLIRYGTDYFNG